MNSTFANFRAAHTHGDGYLLASTLTPASPPADPNHLSNYVGSSNFSKINTDAKYGIVWTSEIDLPKPEANAWVDVYVAHWKAAAQVVTAEGHVQRGAAKDANWARVYEAWKEVGNALISGYAKGLFAAWTVPCLYVTGRYLRTFAIRADEQAEMTKGKTTFNAGMQDDIVDALGQNEKLEDAARLINKIFGLCINDRSPIEESRKWGLYYITNLLFKTYFKLNSISLSKNILRSLNASATDMPPLSAFPKAHIVTFEYYVGVIHFLEEDFAKAEEHLTNAYQICHPAAAKNRALILTYLIPCRLLTSHQLPTPRLLAPYPNLQRLFAPLASCIRRGDLAGFDAALAAGQDEFVKRRIYLTLERGRDIALRNLFRRVFLAGGFEEGSEGQVRRTRVPIQEFMAGMRVGLGGGGGGDGEHVRQGGVAAAVEGVDRDEVECLVANLIYRKLIKGYISREHGKVVLAKVGAFPGTGV